ncbi:MAG: hypothetical protein WBW08_02870 [Methyloceanibacter sp.]
MIDIVVHPLQELLAGCRDDAGLHVVDVGVDEAGGDDAAGIVRDRNIDGQFASQSVTRPGGLDQPIAADHEPVGLMHEGAPWGQEGSSVKETRVPRSAVG